MGCCVIADLGIIVPNCYFMDVVVHTFPKLLSSQSHTKCSTLAYCNKRYTALAVGKMSNFNADIIEEEFTAPVSFFNEVGISTGLRRMSVLVAARVRIRILVIVAVNQLILQETRSSECKLWVGWCLQSPAYFITFRGGSSFYFFWVTFGQVTRPLQSNQGVSYFLSFLESQGLCLDRLHNFNANLTYKMLSWSNWDVHVTLSSACKVWWIVQYVAVIYPSYLASRKGNCELCGSTTHCYEKITVITSKSNAC